MRMTKKNSGGLPAEKGAASAGLLPALAVTLAGVLFLPQMLLPEGRGLGFSNSFLSVTVFLLAFPQVRRGLQRGWQGAGSVATLLLSFGFVLACAIGSRLEAQGYLLLTDWRLWVSLPVLTLFFAALLERLYGLGQERCARAGGPGRKAAVRGCGGNGPEPSGGRTAEGQPAGAQNGGIRSLLSAWERLPLRKRRLIVFLLFLLVWGIVLLGVWPGFFVYDAQEEFNQVAQRRFTTHHPLLHVLLLGGIVSAGNKLFGSYNAGIACYMLFQMAVLAFVFAWVTDLLRKKGAPLWLRAGGTLYFAFFPVIQMYVLCSAKDTLYSAAMLAVTALLLQAAQEKEAFFADGKKMGLLALCMALMALMRHNGLYILILLIPVLAALAGKRMRIRAALFGLAALLLSLGTSAGLKTVFHAQDSENQEMLTVPIQQLARTWTLSPEAFTREEEEALFSYLPEEALLRYTPKLSDNVKIAFDNEAYAADSASFWKLWLNVGKKAPASYLNAWLLTSYGFWYPDAVLDCYEGNTVFTFTYGESSYFGYETELPGQRKSLLPWLDGLFRRMSLELFQQRIPVLAMLFSPGFLFWIYAAGAGFLIRNRSFRTAAAFLPAGLNWLTVLLGPASLVRYVLILWFALPVLALVVSQGKLCYTNTTMSEKG